MLNFKTLNWVYIIPFLQWLHALPLDLDSTVVELSKRQGSDCTTNKIKKIAYANVESGNITGRVTFIQYDGLTAIRVLSKFSGLTPGQHGFHIHASPVSTNCESTGAHFNPRNVSHGAWNAQTRHTGDLMALQAQANGEASHFYADPLISFEGENNIIGRAIVIHALADDLGLGGNENSTKTGNAGGN
jgi:Cu-Zn family superoxide dismutase